MMSSSWLRRWCFCVDLSRTFHTRILERQKMVQTSQVLFRPLCVSLAVVLPFKDSQGGTWLLN
jgi:hypothetical protein